MSFRPITDTWLLARPKVPYHGAYPAGFLERARWMLPVLPTDPVLHVCAGRVRDYSSPDRGVKKGVPLRGFYPSDITVDIDPLVSPDVVCDVSQPGWASNMYAFATLFRGILIDRPYTEDDAKKQGLKYTVGKFPWAASGRAIANGRDEGFTKLIFDEATHRVIGGGIVGTHAGDLISEVCLAVEMGCEPTDIGKTIHPHPTLGESIGMTAEVFEGHCTDLPPQKKK